MLNTPLGQFSTFDTPQSRIIVSTSAAIRNADGSTDTVAATVDTFTFNPGLMKPGTVCRLQHVWTCTGGASTKIMQANFGASSLAGVSTTSNTQIGIYNIFWCGSVVTTQKAIPYGNAWTNIGASAIQVPTNDMSTPINLNFACRWTANAPGEFIQLEYWMLEIINP